ncbi:MAG: hypothetical protein H6698_01615 [Myxococcales bacterium]|nr:hypothetical protein [Myxococcales bacterium]
MRFRLSSRRSALAALGAALLIPPPSAYAQAGQDELQLSVGPALTVLHGDLGAGAEAGASLGLAHGLSLGVHAGGGTHFGADKFAFGGLFAGPALSADVVSFVPFVTVMPGVWFGGPAAPRPQLATRVSLGVDYRRRRSWSGGVELGWVPRLAPTPDPAAAFVVALRLSAIRDRNALR